MAVQRKIFLLFSLLFWKTIFPFENSSNFVYWDFLGRRLRIYNQIFKIQDGGSNIAVKNLKISPMFMKIGIQGFFESLITNLQSDFQNSRWQIQHGGQKLKISPIFMKIGI